MQQMQSAASPILQCPIFPPCLSIPTDVASDLTEYPQEHEDLILALISAVLPRASSGVGFDELVLPELAAANKGSALADQCLQPGDRPGPNG